METPQEERRVREFFRIGVLLKGAHALLELIGGVLLLVAVPTLSALPQIVTSLTQEELGEDPNDLVANFLLHSAQSVSISGEVFGALYLLSHGIIKLLLVVALLKNKLWAYPWSLGVLGLFVAYQLYRFSHTHSPWLILLSAFDMIVLYFIWREYRIIQEHLKLGGKL